MPNWCSNGVTITHSDPAKIAALAEAMKEGRFLDHIKPVPLCLKETVAGRVGAEGSPEQLALEQSQQDNLNNHNYKDWYDFCVNEWGTKWDVQSDSVAIENDNTVSASFDSAWAPPVRAYEQMTEMGFEIIAYYYEPGMGFVGKWDNGIDEFYEYGGETSETVRDVIGEELDDYFCISESMAEWEEENAEE